MSIYHKVGSGASAHLEEFASKVSYDDSTNTLRINGTPHQIGSDQLVGNLGEVAYTAPEGVKKQQILRSDVYICENKDDYDATLAATFSFKNVFETWECGEAWRGSWLGYSSDFPANIDNINRSLEFNRSYASEIYSALINGQLSIDPSDKDPHGNVLTPEWYRVNKEPKSYDQLLTQRPQPGWQLYSYYFTNGLSGNALLSSAVSSDQCKYVYHTNQTNGYNFWIYNEVLSSIVQCLNVGSTAFYVSPRKYTDYILDAELYSSDGDNDEIGLVGAFAVDVDETTKKKNPKLLTFMRYGGANDKSGGQDKSTVFDNYGGVGTWFAMMPNQQVWPDARWSVLSTCSYSYLLSARKAPDDDETAWARSWTGKKTRMEIRRSGDVISARISRFVPENDPTPDLDNASKIVINLNSQPRLSAFTAENGGAAFGFTTNSQPMTSWKILNFRVPKTIYRLDTHEKIVYNIDGTTTTTVGKFNEEIGIGRLITNEITRKTFYVTLNSIAKVALADDFDSSGSSVSFNPNSSTLTIGDTPYTISDGTALASTIRGKNPIIVKDIGKQSSNDFTACSYTTEVAGWYKFCTSYNNKDGDMWNDNTLWSAICYGTGGGNDTSVLVSGWGSYWVYTMFLPAGFSLTLQAFKGTSETSTASGRRTIYLYQ